MSTAPFLLELFTEKQTVQIVMTYYQAGSWFVLEGPLPGAEDPNVNQMILSVSAHMNPKWTGRVWIDDFRID